MVNHMNAKTIVFPEDRPIRAVQAWGGSNFTRRLTFLDAENEEIDFYEPSVFHFERDGPLHELEEGESLIGFYGEISDRRDYFTSFGFITKINKPRVSDAAKAAR